MKDQALYLEADEDITSAIDKLTKTPGTSVQIVVPKRSALLQSIINLKLLKKAAADAGKELILVTGDKVASDLAARVGLAVAPSLGAKSVVGESAPAPLAAAEDVIEADDDPAPPPLDTVVEPVVKLKDKPKVPKKPFFARKPVAAAAPAAAVVESSEAIPGESVETVSKPPRLSKGVVPNYGKLQRRLIWIVLAVVLVGGYFVGMGIFAKATVVLYATGTKVAVDTTFSVDPAQTASSSTSGVLAGQTVSYSKDLTGPITPTGTQDQGTKASGTIVFKNCEDSSVYPLAAGNTITSQGLTYVTASAISIPAGTFSNGGKSCTSPTVSVQATATANGDKYNLANASYTTPKLTANFQITGAQMSGGTSKTVTVVAQGDVDKAKTELLAADKDGGQKALDGHVPSGYTALTGSDNVTAGDASSIPAVDTAATSATATVHVTYTELAVKQTDYVAFIKAKELTQVGPTNQIYDDGLSSAQLTPVGKDASGRAQFHLSAQAYSGAKLSQATIATSLAGKRYGDANDLATKLPGVQRAAITLTPSWSTSLPHNAKKIKVTIQVASAS